MVCPERCLMLSVILAIKIITNAGGGGFSDEKLIVSK